jgi:diguanylate cyclase (GGDEF)-like protein
MIDLDGYKQLNDTMGHQVGDQLLVMAGKVISANMRRMDVAARYGGDEFVLLIPHTTGREATLIAARIREEFCQASAALLRREPDKGLTMSIGIASMRESGVVGGDPLVARADAALYQAKAAGRNRIIVAGPPTGAFGGIPLQPHPTAAPPVVQHA